MFNDEDGGIGAVIALINCQNSETELQSNLFPAKIILHKTRKIPDDYTKTSGWR